MEENFWLKPISFILPILSCLGAVASGYYAFIAGRLSKGGLAYQFFSRYSEEKMRTALDAMGKFKREYNELHGENFIRVWHAAFKNKDLWAMDLERSRHTIKYFYRDVATLYQSRCMRYSIAEKICSAGGVYLFDECILPMDELINNYRHENEYYPIPQSDIDLNPNLKQNPGF